MTELDSDLVSAICIDLEEEVIDAFFGEKSLAAGLSDKLSSAVDSVIHRNGLGWAWDRAGQPIPTTDIEARNFADSVYAAVRASVAERFDLEAAGREIAQTLICDILEDWYNWFPWDLPREDAAAILHHDRKAATSAELFEKLEDFRVQVDIARN